MRWWQGLAFKLAGASLAVALASIVLLALLTQGATTSGFSTYLARAQAMHDDALREGSPGPSTAGLDIEEMMRRMMGGMGGGEMAQLMGRMMGPPEEAFLAGVRQALVLAGAGSAGLALLLSVLLARHLLLPLRRLTAAVRQVSQGDLSQRVVVGSRDELGELAGAFNAMAESLARAEEARRNLVADVAHELRTPLAVLRANVEALVDGVAAPSAARLASLEEEVLLLGRLVEDLSTLSLADAGQLPLERRTVALGAVVERALLGVQAQAAQRQVAIRAQVEPGLPDILADGDRIGQVLNNLLSNALRYTPSGGTIEVLVRREDGSLVTRVSDSGPGIAAEDLPHVFERLYRADRSRSRATGGSGLGLAIVKQLVEAHGGRVDVESAPGQGSAFSFSLPLGATAPSSP